MSISVNIYNHYRVSEIKVASSDGVHWVHIDFENHANVTFFTPTQESAEELVKAFRLIWPIQPILPEIDPNEIPF